MNSGTQYHNKQGLIHKREKHWDEAIAEFEQTLKFSPDNTFALSNLAHIYFIQNDPQQAQHFVEMARKSNPNDWFACGLQGDILGRLGDLAGATSAYEEQLALKPDAIYAYVNLGIVYRQQGKLNAALSILKQGLEIAPQMPKLYHVLGDVYAALKQNEQALAQYQRAIELNANDDYAFNRWLACQLKQKNPETAVTELKQVLKIPSRRQNAHLHVLLALQLKNLKRYEEAIAELQTAVKLNPNAEYFRTQLAFCYSKNGEYARVIELLKPIYKMRPQDALVAAAMVKAYLNLNERQQAQTILDDSLKHQPNNRYLLMMKKKLQNAK
ncbi:tetratricopeptide repeat protein [Candidatus Poribacteria bacterium]|nr:tetratricopeptide repeat protein [Candidatus Poribacteria bacterium]